MAEDIGKLLGYTDAPEAPASSPDIGVLLGYSDAEQSAPAQPAPTPAKPQGPTISANPPSLLERLAAPFVGEGSAFGIAQGKRQGAKFAAGQDQFKAPLIDFAGAHAEDEFSGTNKAAQVSRAVVRGLGNVASGLTTPQNAELLTATFGSAGLPVVSRMISAGFGAQMLYGAYQQSKQLRDRIKAGDLEGAVQAATEMGLGGAMAAGALIHAGSKSGPPGAAKEVRQPDSLSYKGEKPYFFAKPKLGVSPGLPPPAYVDQQTSAHAKTIVEKLYNSAGQEIYQPPSEAPAAPVEAPAEPLAARAAPSDRTTEAAAPKSTAPAIPAGFEVETPATPEPVKETPLVKTPEATAPAASEPARVSAAGGGQPETSTEPAARPEPKPKAETKVAPAGWDSVEGVAHTRHPSVDLTDEELRARSKNDPLPAPSGSPESILPAWNTVSRILPDLARKVTSVDYLPHDAQENAAINVHTGALRIHPSRPLTAETLWHELIHLDQPEAQAGRNALEPDAFNSLEVQARAGISDALKRFNEPEPEAQPKVAASEPAPEPADNVPAPEPPKPSASATMGAGLGALQPYYERMVASLKDSADEVRALKAKRDAALEALKRSEITPEEKQHGARLREYMTGERDFWGARVNQTMAKLKKLVPNHVDQEALSLMRDFKNRPGELQQFADGTHPDLMKLAPEDYKSANDALEKIRPVIARAIKPTLPMRAADAVLSQVADMTLKEGQKVGFLDSSLASDEYTPHLLHPKGEGEFAEGMKLTENGSAIGGKFGKNFGFAKERTIPTLAHAVAYGLRPKTLNAFDAFTIHGDKFATARATHLLVKTLKGEGVGKWGSQAGQGHIPDGWVEIAPHAHPFQNVRSFIDSEGNAQTARQTLYVPKFIEEAMRPITDPNYMNRVAGFRKVRAFQAVAKAGELGLSLFHLKAENYMALSNMGPRGWAKAQMIDRASPEFLMAERDMILHGGTSAIQGRTFEAYKSLQPGSIPTITDIVRKWPVIKQLDQAAGGLTSLIFDNQMRRFKVTNYALRKASWMAEHPEATPAEHSAAMHSITQELNAVYGGLHWENLGVNRASQEMARFLMLAPDWTFSNVFNVKTAFKGGLKGNEGSKMARAFWIRSIVGGLAATQGYSLLMSGKVSKNPTMAYLGDDNEGREVYQNVAFAGAPSDLVNLVNNINRYGALEGPLKSAMGKSAPAFRAAMEVAFNEDFLHHKITSPEFSVAGNTARGAWFLTKSLAPIPFTFTNVIDMAANGNGEQQATAKEILGTLLFGQAAKHVAPEGERWSPRHGLQPAPERPERSFSEEFFQTVR